MAFHDGGMLSFHSGLTKPAQPAAVSPEASTADIAAVGLLEASAARTALACLPGLHSLGCNGSNSKQGPAHHPPHPPVQGHSPRPSLMHMHTSCGAHCTSIVRHVLELLEPKAHRELGDQPCSGSQKRDTAL